MAVAARLASNRTFAELLYSYRTAAGLTQEILAERASLSARGISDLERGVRRNPRRHTVRLLADALELAIDERGALEQAAARSSDSAARSRPEPRIPSGIDTPLFTGRTRELAFLDHWIGGTGPPVLMVAGEPGVGKTRLLQETAHRAWEQGWSIVQNSCQRHDGHESYAPVLGAIERRIARMTPAQTRLDLRGCAGLVRALPELGHTIGEPLPAWDSPSTHERRLIFAAVARFLSNIAGPAGTMLVLDDLHWARAEAFNLMASLVQSRPDKPLRIIGTYRQTAVHHAHALSNMLADLAHAGLVNKQILFPLAIGDAATLLDELIGDAEQGKVQEREWIIAQSGGVPFFLLAYAQSLREGTLDQGVPWAIAQSIRQRITALPPLTQEALRAAAVVGCQVTCSLLTSMLVWPEEDVLAALDHACAAHLLAEDGEHAYEFVHHVIREVIVEDPGAARRASLHQRMVAASTGSIVG